MDPPESSPPPHAGSARWFVLAFLAVVLLGAGAGLWIRQSNFEDPTYLPTAGQSTASVSGRAVDAEGRPLAGLTLIWMQAQGEHKGGLFLGGRMFAGLGEEALSGPDGSFRFEGLDPNVGFVAVSSDHDLQEGHTGQFEARAGFEASGLELRVEEVPAARRAVVRLVHPDGSPAARLRIKGRASALRGSWSATRLTGPTGEAEFVSPWKGGTFTLTVTAADGTETDFEDIPVGEGTIERVVPR